MVRKIDELLNKKIINIDVVDKLQIIFNCENNEKYMMEHEQDCCEKVWLEDINGDLENLLNSPILLAEEVYEKQPCESRLDGGTCTWTFYKFATAKGYVTMRWYGESTGFYSERVSIYKLDE